MKPLLRLFPYLKKNKRTLILGLLTVLMANIFGNFVPLIVGGAIDQLKSGPSSLKLVQYAALIISLIFLSGFFTFLTRQTIIVTSRKIEFDLVNDFYSHIQKLSYQFFLNIPTGDLMAHATNDISAVRNVLGPGIMYTSDTITGFIMVIAIMFSINVKLTLYSLIPLPFVSAAVYYIGRLVNRNFEEVQAQYSSLTARAQETISGVRIVRSYVREDYETERFRSLSHDYFRKNMILAQVQSILAADGSLNRCGWRNRNMGGRVGCNIRYPFARHDGLVPDLPRFTDMAANCVRLGHKYLPARRRFHGKAQQDF